MTRLSAVVSLLLAWLFSCPHRNLGSLRWNRGGQRLGLCASCNQMAPAPEDDVNIKPPVLTCDVDRAAHAEQVQRAYLEQLAMRQPDRKTALQRMAEEGSEDWVRQSGVKW